MNEINDVDWHKNRNLIRIGDRFILHDKHIVEISGFVEGDATKMYVLDFYNKSWFAEGSTIEPSDIKGKLNSEKD